MEVTVPEIEEMRLGHYVTMGSECTASLAKYLDGMDRSEIGWDVRIALTAYKSFSSRDYLNAQRLRYVMPPATRRSRSSVRPEDEDDRNTAVWFRRHWTDAKQGNKR